MALRPSKLMEERLKELLTRDKMGAGEGFSSAMTKDLARVFADYFDLVSQPVAAVVRDEDGMYEVKVTVRASAVRRFRTTEEMQPPESFPTH